MKRFSWRPRLMLICQDTPLSNTAITYSNPPVDFFLLLRFQSSITIAAVRLISTELLDPGRSSEENMRRSLSSFASILSAWSLSIVPFSACRTLLNAEFTTEPNRPHITDNVCPFFVGHRDRPCIWTHDCPVFRSSNKSMIVQKHLVNVHECQKVA